MGEGGGRKGKGGRERDKSEEGRIKGNAAFSLPNLFIDVILRQKGEGGKASKDARKRDEKGEEAERVKKMRGYRDTPNKGSHSP